MSYKTQATLANDSLLFNRITACAALEDISDPVTWSYNNKWLFSAQPGWSAAYAYALAAKPGSEPGNDEAVITDGMILSAVQLIRGPVVPVEPETTE